MSEAVMLTREAVAGEVRALMGRYQITQTTLAAAAGMSQPALSRCLNAKQAFDLDQLVGIAQFFDLPISRLIEVSPGSCCSRVDDQLTFDLDGGDQGVDATHGLEVPVLAVVAA